MGCPSHSFENFQGSPANITHVFNSARLRGQIAQGSESSFALDLFRSLVAGDQHSGNPSLLEDWTVGSKEIGLFDEPFTVDRQ